MRLHTKILAGTALGLLVGTLYTANPTLAATLTAPAGVPLSKATSAATPLRAADQSEATILLAQAQPAEEERPPEEGTAPATQTPNQAPQPEVRPERPPAAEAEEDAPPPAAPQVEPEPEAEPEAEAAPPEPEPRPEPEAQEPEAAPAEEAPPAETPDAADQPETQEEVSEPPVVPDTGEEGISDTPVVPDEAPTPGDEEITAPPVVPETDDEGISDAPVVPDEQPAPGDGDITDPPVTPDADADQDERPATGDDAITAPPEVSEDEEAGLPENAAPVLDSAKEEAIDGTPTEGRPERRAAPAEEAAPPPQDDASALAEDARPVDMESAVAEEGRRIERSEERGQRRERPEGAEVLREIGDRIVIQFNNQTIVESSDRPRMSRDAREVFYEELPRGREREIIVRGDGTQIVTIRNRYGDVVRRSRIAPDGREIVLSYVDERNYDRVRDWRDPGADLPPLRLGIPVREYILDARTADTADAYYDFLYQPPVERVERLYSVDEVKRSARIRDTVRRVDMDTITFEFGSASITEAEIPRLENVATAMERLLERNPAETFLIEGHTDAVGSDLANLALSDRRAEGVAEALTNVFGIPPENLATQGYGERYLKIKTEEPERLNRRVAIRRITPLVAPVASAN
jgi:outer membrane protein OmpA-like peptidoglycan-associated protein